MGNIECEGGGLNGEYVLGVMISTCPDSMQKVSNSMNVDERKCKPSDLFGLNMRQLHKPVM